MSHSLRLPSDQHFLGYTYNDLCNWMLFPKREMCKGECLEYTKELLVFTLAACTCIFTATEEKQ